MTIQEFATKYELTFNQVNFGCVRKRIDSNLLRLKNPGRGGSRWQRDVLETPKSLAWVKHLKVLNRPCPTVVKAKENAERSSFYRHDGAMAQECKRANYPSLHAKRIKGYQSILGF